MTTATDHESAETHRHTHGPSCGHGALIHEDHVDYLRELLVRRLHLCDVQARRLSAETRDHRATGRRTTRLY